MAFHDETDPNKPVTEFEEFPDGEHAVSGIDSWLSKSGEDASAVPVFVPDKFSPDLVARFRLRLTNGEEGPPMSANKATIVALTKALGADYAQLAGKDSTAFLLTAQRLMDEANGSANAVVRKGWVRRVAGAVPDEGLYSWRYYDMRSPNGKEPLQFAMTKGQYPQDAVYLNLVIDGDLMGKPTIWDGWVQFVMLINPFDGTHEDPDGRKPNFSKAANGGRPIAVTRFLKFVNCFIDPDEISNYGWAGLESSQYGVDEAENPMPVIKAMAEKANRRAVGGLGVTSGFAKVDLKDFQVVDQSSVATEVEEGPCKTFNDLMRFCESLAKTGVGSSKVDGPVFVVDDQGDTQLTPNAIEWAKGVIGPVWDMTQGLPSERAFHLLQDSDELSKLLLDALKNKYPSEPSSF